MSVCVYVCDVCTHGVVGRLAVVGGRKEDGDSEGDPEQQRKAVDGEHSVQSHQTNCGTRASDT